MKALIFTLFLFVGCDRTAQVSKDNFGLRIGEISMDLSQLNEVIWWIGAKRKEDKVTQSVTFIIQLPKLADKDRDHLKKERDVDSWLIRVIQVKGSSAQDLGSMLIPFFPKQYGRSTSQSTSNFAAVKIYYAAAYASERMRALSCPSFGHDKRISDMNFKGENTPFEVVVTGGTSYREKSQETQLAPSSFNGGNSLKGEYYFEIAPYNSKNKMLMGSFKRIPRYLEITSEKSISVPSCQDRFPD